MINEKKHAELRMLILIAPPKLARRAAELFDRGQVPFQYQFHGQGTVSGELLAGRHRFAGQGHRILGAQGRAYDRIRPAVSERIASFWGLSDPPQITHPADTAHLRRCGGRR